VPRKIFKVIIYTYYMKYIVTTTIYPPSVALKKFAEMKDWKLLVVGDLKTPHEEYENMNNIIYLSPETQENLYKDLSDLIGWNCIQRRNIGFIHAYKLGATLVASVDDDNIPLDNWGQDIKVDIPVNCTIHSPLECDVFDPISVTEYSKLWHRGFPIQNLSQRASRAHEGVITPSFQANFWNGDPDVDAICRMEHRPLCEFSATSFPFSSNKPSPFNSQNTIISRTALRDYFCFPFAGRMDDIWGSYYALSQGHSVIYDVATVFQERNNHDLTKDFTEEIIGYKNTVDLLKDPSNIKKFIPARSWAAYVCYRNMFEQALHEQNQ
jgi:hypothetical protein